MKAFTNAAGFGIYAADQIALHEYFDIIGGLRWDYFSANQQNKLPGQVDFDITDKMLSYRVGWFFIRRHSETTTFPMLRRSIPPPRG